MQAENLVVTIEYLRNDAEGFKGWYYILKEKLVPGAHITHDIVGPFESAALAVKSLHERSQK